MSPEQMCGALVKQDFATTGVSTFKSASYDLNIAGVLSRVIVPLNSNRTQALYETCRFSWMNSSIPRSSRTCRPWPEPIRGAPALPDQRKVRFIERVVTDKFFVSVRK